MKSLNSESCLSTEGINAEFKKLRKRIEKLEDIILAYGTDMGNISNKLKKENKG